MKSVRTWSKVLLLALAGAVLAGCGKAPPDCADITASDALRTTMNAWISEALPFKGVQPKEDGGALIGKYLATWTFNLSNVTTAGYDEKSRTRSCAGKVAIAIPDTQQGATVDVEYEMQMLEDAMSGEFQLRTDGRYKTWSYGLVVPVADHYKVYGVSGTWVGTSDCRPTKVEKSQFVSFPREEAEQGFAILDTEIPWLPDEATKQLAVKAVIVNGKVTVEIAGPEGKTITRTASFGADGRFQTAADDEVKSAVPEAGYISSDGMIYASVHSISSRARLKSHATGNELDGVLTRACGLRLAKQQ